MKLCYDINSNIVISNVDKAHIAGKCGLSNYTDYLDIYIDSTRYDFLVGKTVQVISAPYTDTLTFCNEVLCNAEFIDVAYDGKLYSVLNGMQCSSFDEFNNLYENKRFYFFIS